MSVQKKVRVIVHPNPNPFPPVKGEYLSANLKFPPLDGGLGLG
jgi:hypothetical protein